MTLQTVSFIITNHFCTTSETQSKCNHKVFSNIYYENCVIVVFGCECVPALVIHLTFQHDFRLLDLHDLV